MIDASAISRMLDARLRKVARVHFVGIGGSGMAGIAEVLLNLGYTSAVRTPKSPRLCCVCGRWARRCALVIRPRP